MSMLDILAAEEDWLAVNKPAGLVCHPTKNGELSSLIGRARLHLGTDARPHLVNRLDRETSGVLLIATTARGARELGKLWSRRRMDKEYVALVHGHVAAGHGVIEAPLGSDAASRVRVKDCVRSDGAAARTDYEVLRRDLLLTPGGEPLPVTQLRLWPRTGRKHQIRIHLSHIGHPVVGDKLYGGCEDDYLAFIEGRLGDEQRARLLFQHHALHARALRFMWRERWYEYCCAPPQWIGS